MNKTYAVSGVAAVVRLGSTLVQADGFDSLDSIHILLTGDLMIDTSISIEVSEG